MNMAEDAMRKLGGTPISAQAHPAPRESILATRASPNAEQR